MCQILQKMMLPYRNKNYTNKQNKFERTTLNHRINRSCYTVDDFENLMSTKILIDKKYTYQTKLLTMKSYKEISIMLK